MPEFKDAGVSFFNRLKTGKTKESSSSGVSESSCNIHGDVGVSSNHAAFRLFKSLSEAASKDRKSHNEGKRVAKPSGNKLSTNMKERRVQIVEAFICSRCMHLIHMPEEGNDVACRCGSVYPYKAAKALYESQHNTGE